MYSHIFKYMDAEPLDKTLEIIGNHDIYRGSNTCCWHMLTTGTQNFSGRPAILLCNGIWGIATGGIKHGHIVTITPEVKIPLILTPEFENENAPVKYNRIAGTAYIDCIMDGESMWPELVEDIERKQGLEEFLIHRVSAT
jgi:hypothetical protein